jgi:hypothetical protein
LRGWQLAFRLAHAMGASASDQAELWPMTTKRASNGTAVYRDRIRPFVGKTHRAECGDPPGIISPVYRGFKIHCIGSEIEAKKRAVDRYWSDRYNLAVSPAEKVQSLMEERAMRDAPLEWTGA